MSKRRVSRAELEAFLKAYPRPLERDVFGAFEPPLVTWNDFSDGKVWPESVVASMDLEGENCRLHEAGREREDT